MCTLRCVLSDGKCACCDTLLPSLHSHGHANEKAAQKAPTEGTPCVSQSQKNEGKDALRITRTRQHGKDTPWQSHTSKTWEEAKLGDCMAQDPRSDGKSSRT